jgi:hypothetical protein
MKFRRIIGVALVLLAGLEIEAAAQDTVTIPKSRLEELEKKEEELKRLKKDFSATKSENVELHKQHESDAVKISRERAAEPAPTRESPPMAALLALKAGEVVAAVDLANHYRADPAAADQRYRQHRIRVEGEIVRFDKPLFTKDYKLVLKTADRDSKVICDIYPPEKYSAVFTVKEGLELVGVMGETRVPIAKVGNTVIVEGSCRGARDSAVRLSTCELKTVK